MAKVLAVLYDDPVDGYPKKYARDDVPKITKYPYGQTTPPPTPIRNPPPATIFPRSRTTPTA